MIANEMRTLPRIRAEDLAGVEEALGRKDLECWQLKRLSVVRMVAQHTLTARQIAAACGVCRDSVFDFLRILFGKGIAGLLGRGNKGGNRAPRMDAALQKEFRGELGKGRFRRAKEARAWLAGRGVDLTLPVCYYWLKKAGGVLKLPRKTHLENDAAKTLEFRETPGARLLALARGHDGPVRLWVADEHRYGLLPVIRRCWGLRGVRVRAPYRTRYKWGYLYEAPGIDGDNRSEFWFMPTVNKGISAEFLRQLSAGDPGTLHIVIWDGAGFHQRDGEAGVPANVRLLALPPYSPELNPVEGVGDSVKDAVCNKVYDTLETLEEAITEELRPLMKGGAAVAGRIHTWMRLKANASVPT
jgi:transposase